MHHGGFWAVSISVHTWQHLVPWCHVLATKHNSSVSLSGCHFTKPERLLEITSICGKTNERGRGRCRTWLPTSAVPTRAAMHEVVLTNGQTNQPREEIIVPRRTILSPFLSPMLSSHSDIPDIPPLTAALSFSSSHPACFYIPSAPLLRLSLHPSTHCVMSLLCESEQFVWQPNCNATPLTWKSQQSVVLVRETFLEAAVLTFYRKQTSSVANLKTKKGTVLNKYSPAKRQNIFWHLNLI